MPDNTNIPRIAFTPGEPAGIGVDLCIVLTQKAHNCQIVVIADPDLLQQRATLLKLPLVIELFDENQLLASKAGHVFVLPVKLTAPVICGALQVANSRYVLETIRLATLGCVHRQFAAMVTGPVHKGVINDAGIPFTGHTEFIAELTGGTPIMMLATPGLRVALATTHLPLSNVSAAINKNGLSTLLRLLDQDLKRYFALTRPHILVCGLNPHAGENGHLGREEIEIIEPVIEQLRTEGLNLTGPLPADTLFTPKNLATADAVLAMYHDQGLPVLKHLGFGQAVNITLGLPIIRTSVDHGTALDLAGSGQADAGSLHYALQIALTMIGGQAI